MLTRTIFTFIALSIPLLSNSKTVSYEFDIDTKQVNITGEIVEALAIADQIPAPTIEANVGDVLRATFHNRLDVSASVHWHGVLLPGDQDGVPFLNTQPIPPGSSYTYEFPILHAGTFWYHSHSEFQIQRGIYGSIIFRGGDSRDELFSEAGQNSVTVQEQIVLFSDWTNEDPGSVLANLKKDDDYYAFKKDNVQSWDKVLANGVDGIRNRFDQAITRMGPMDLADIGYDAFLINGQQSSTVPVLDDRAEQVLLRMINGSTSSYFDVEYAGGPMTIIAADGQDVEPVRVQRLRISTAETYDVLVPVMAGMSAELRATSIDGSGFGSLFIGEGQQVKAPDIPAPNLVLMNHMDMAMNDGMSMMDHENANEHESVPGMMNDDVIAHMTDYESLMAVESTALPSNQPWREIHLRLTGNMERYVWSFNDKTLREETQILIRKGENVRFILSNDTMMHHPLHLHGHFFRVVNRNGDRSPLKHTVNVPPMATVVIEFDANEEKDWLFHCHNQYHMKTGMNRVVSYIGSSTFNTEMSAAIQPSLRWFRKSEFSAQSNFVDFETSISDERHGFSLEWDSDFDGSYELEGSYNYYFSQFLSAFTGVEKKQHARQGGSSRSLGESKLVAGLNYTLPLMIGSEWRVDDDGEFRLELESELQFTRRLGFGWRWNTDNEHRYSLIYNVTKRWALTVNTDSEYGDGVGVQYLF